MDIQILWITLFLVGLAHCATLEPGRNKRGVVYFRKVCFEGVDCFNNSAPFDNAEGILPDSPQVVGTQFLLLTRDNKIPDPLRFNDSASLRLSHFDPGKHVVFLIHGFAQTGAAEWIKPMADALLEKGDFNIVVVDWGPGAKFPHYMQATANSRLVGKLTNILIQHMIEMGSATVKMHLIGHSLGAHVAGYAGEGLKTKLGQIAGLDPADPLFEGGDPKVRLDPTDADFVGVVHTNGEPIYLGGYGMYAEVGHADFYINGGQIQPGCSSTFDSLVSDLLKGKITDAMGAMTCSHSRAHDIYLESIKSIDCIFLAYQCNNTDDFNAGRCLSCNDGSCVKMGYDVNTTHARGKYFMKTRSEQPFCGLHYAVTVNTAQGGKTKGQLILTFIGADGNVSDPIHLFHEDATLQPGQPHEYVVVVSHEVNDIEAIEITYKKHESWIVWTNGMDHWLPDYIEITPGGKLDRTTKWFCLNGTKIGNNTPTRFTHSKDSCQWRK